MNYKPSNLYIGIIDLFAILLPGAVATLVIYHFFRLEINNFLHIGNENWGYYNGFVLLFASYLFGHIISQVSAYMDELIYNRLEEKVYKDQKCGKKVEEIRKVKFGNNLDQGYVNAYKWSIYKLQKENPGAASEIERYMADSKFFRSLFVLLLGLIMVLLFTANFDIKLILICLSLAIFSVVRYFKKRHKATETAFQHIIFLEELNVKNESNEMKSNA